MSEKTAERARPAGKPRRRRFWRDLVADPVRKLLALALAILLWIFLDSQITESKSVEFKLIGERSASEAAEAEIRDSHIVVHPPAGYRVVGFRDHMTAADIKDNLVEVVFEAPRHQLRNILAEPGLSVRPRQDEINQRTHTIMFDLSELQSQDYGVVKALRDMRPRRVDAVLERIDARSVTLDKSFVKIIYPDSNAHPDFSQRLRLDAAQFAPQEVFLQGPRSITEAAHTGVPLFELDLSGFGAYPEPKITRQLVPTPPDNVTIQGLPVTISIPLDPIFEQYEMSVPVIVDTANRSSPTASDFEFDPAMKVVLYASGELAGVLSSMKDASELDKWAKRNARVVVRLDDDWRHDAQIYFGTFCLLDERYERRRSYRISGTLSVQIRPKAKNG
ncbi:MAG: hypothetical protein R3F56_04020 [Planctomycetota bacterium]